MATLEPSGENFNAEIMSLSGFLCWHTLLMSFNVDASKKFTMPFFMPTARTF